MDDIVQHVLEQAAFDGIMGTSIPRLWTFVQEYFVKQGQVQNLDSAYKNYLWRLLVQCDEFVIAIRSKNAKGVTEACPLNKPCADLAHLEDTHGESLIVCTTEERQWITLTGHGVDHKDVRTY